MHVLDKFKLSRRHMLRGLIGGSAVAIGLPPLEAMMGRSRTASAGDDLPKRFISFFFGNGVQLRNFEPDSPGADWTPSVQLQPFADAGVKDFVTICSGMRNRTESQPITHHEGITVMSGHDYIPSDAGGFASDWGGPTIDQVIADIIAEQSPTPVRSMQVGVTKFDSPVDNGTAAKSLSARGTKGAVTALFPQQNPRTVWSSLFGEFVAPKDDRELRLSVLDAAKEDITALNMRLGTQDRQRFEAHLDSINELQNKISAVVPACSLPEDPLFDNAEDNGLEQLFETNQIMSELMAYAFVCDVTRVASNLFCSVASEAVFGDVDISSSTHHGHSHANDEGYNQNIQFVMSCLAQLLVTLRDTEDAGGESLLESTLVFGSSELSQGYSHSWQRQPMIIGGHGRNHIRYPGVHYQATPQMDPNDDQSAAGNTTDVLLTLARAFDPGIPSIGSGAMMSDSVLSEIMM